MNGDLSRVGESNGFTNEIGHQSIPSRAEIALPLFPTTNGFHRAWRLEDTPDTHFTTSLQLAERAGMNVQILRNKLNPAQPHLLTAPEIWLLTDLTEDSTLVDGFLAQIHCLPCVPINEVAKEKLPHYVMSATAEIGRVAAGAVSGDVKTSAGRRDAISSINSVTRLMALAAVSLQARLQANPAMASAVDTVTGLGASFGLL